MQKFYTLYAKNLYALAATLVHLRIPFNYNPNKLYKRTELRKASKSTIEIVIDERYCSISNILYEMNEKYGNTFDLTIISES